MTRCPCEAGSLWGAQSSLRGLRAEGYATMPGCSGPTPAADAGGSGSGAGGLSEV